MEIFMVGVYKKGKEIVGFRMLALNDNGTTETKDVAYSIALNTLKSGLANIKNLKIENNKIKGVNGSLDRYGTVNKTQSLVILKELHDEKGNFTGYFCSDTFGNTKNLTESDAITFADKLGIANGKVTTGVNGEKHISSIDGSYGVIKVKTPAKTQTKTEAFKENTGNQQATQSNAEVDYYEKAKKLIDELNKHSEYKTSFAKKVAYTVEKYKKCSEKQYNVIKKYYDELIGKEDKPEVKNTETKESKAEPSKLEDKQQPKVEQASSVNTAPVNTESVKKTEENVTPEQRSVRPAYVPLIIGKPETDMDEVLKYQIMKNGNVYVNGLKNPDSEDVKTLVIPETTVLNGKTYKITGINFAAFKGTHIEKVKTSKNIIDIGQEAFMNCKSLTHVDLSESKHNHISMNLFNGCPYLVSIDVGKQVQRIHEGAFNGCKRLTLIELPDTTDTIARNAFLDCVSLFSCKHKAKFINDSAFRGCRKLEEINFDTVTQIGAYAFRDTGFKHLVLPGNINSIGTKAFADCLLLEDVVINEGVQELGEYCFAKLRYRDVVRQYGKDTPYCVLKEITTAKSIISVLSGVFLHVELVKVWTGSTCESHCIGFNIPYERIDGTTLDNSTKVRLKSEMIDSNPIEILYNMLNTESEGASNPAFEMNTSKLVNIPFSDSQLQFFGIERTSENIEPHIKFKAAVNYLQDMSSLFQSPLSNSVLRLQDTFYVVSKELYNDNCNRIYKVTYRIMDTLEEGSYIMVLTDNNLRYICECNLATDIELENYFSDNESIPVDKFLHAGDTLGKQATVSGHSCMLKVDDSYRPINVGELLFERLKKHGITIETTKKDSILYIPAVQLALNLHDGRIWDRPGVISSNTKDCLNLVNIFNYDEMKQALKGNKKASYNESKLFDELTKLSSREVASRTKNIATIEEEKEAQLFQVSKHFREVINKARLNEESITPNLITPEVFMELSRSYWMISKDEQWLRSAGTKSLNKVNEYNIGKYKLIEYKSNQIVKFSNPYMNGQKGAYVFTLMQNNNTIGVYASRYNMGTLVKKLYDLTDMSRVPDDIKPIELMTSAENLDKVHPSLFYNFYDVLQSKNGWSFNSLYDRYSYGASFHIAMYKPTGVFYLTLERMSVTERQREGNKEKITQALRVIPLLPIGNMDRALMVATTTNTNAKDSRLLKELMAIMNVEEINDNGMRLHYNEDRQEMINIRDNYIAARNLVINKVKDVAQYKKLIDDRAVYMLGTLHTGVLKRELGESVEDAIDDIDIDDTDIDMTEFNSEEPDDMDDLVIEDDEEEITLDDNDIDEDSMSFETFFETAKSMGITDETQARAMYISFMNQ